MCNTKIVKKFITLFFLLCSAQVSHLKYSHEVLLDCKFPEYGSFLWKVPYTHSCSFVHWNFSYLGIVKENLSFIRFYHSNNHIKSSSFSSAIWTEEPDYFSL